MVNELTRLSAGRKLMYKHGLPNSHQQINGINRKRIVIVHLLLFDHLKINVYLQTN